MTRQDDRESKMSVVRKGDISWRERDAWGLPARFKFIFLAVHVVVTWDTFLTASFRLPIIQANLSS